MCDFLVGNRENNMGNIFAILDFFLPTTPLRGCHSTAFRFPPGA